MKSEISQNHSSRQPKYQTIFSELQKQAAQCHFGSRLHVKLRDRLIAGINIPNLEKELTQMPKRFFHFAKTSCNKYETRNEVNSQDIMNSTTSLIYPNPMYSLRRCVAGYRDEHRFVERLSCSEPYSRNSCEFQHAKCFRCGKMRHMKSRIFYQTSQAQNQLIFG